MTDLQKSHPSDDAIIDYAEGCLANVRDFEEHIDHCEECAKAVLIARQLHCLSQQKLIPPLSAVERTREKDHLRRQLQTGIQPDTERQNPNSPSSTDQGDKPDRTVWASLGAIGAGVLGVGSSSAGPKPMLAGSEGPPPHSNTATHKTGGGTEEAGHHDATEQGDSENSHEIPVTSADEPPSSHQRRTEADNDEISDLLNQMQELLGSPSSEQPNATEQVDAFSESSSFEHDDNSTQNGVSDHDGFDAGSDGVADSPFDDPSDADTHDDHD